MVLNSYPLMKRRHCSNLSVYVVFMYLLVSLLSSCSSYKHKPIFFTKKGEKVDPLPAIQDLRIRFDGVLDQRDYEKWPLQQGKPKVRTVSGLHCINSTNQYHKAYWQNLSKFSAIYLSRFLGVQKVSQYIEDYDYRIEVVVSDMMLFQKYSHEAKKAATKDYYIGFGVGALGGMVGAIVYYSLSGDSDKVFTTPGRMVIAIDAVNIYDDQNVLVASITDQVLEFSDKEFVADAACTCTFYNLDFHYKQFLKSLAPKIESELMNLVE